MFRQIRKRRARKGWGERKKKQWKSSSAHLFQGQIPLLQRGFSPVKRQSYTFRVNKQIADDRCYLVDQRPGEQQLRCPFVQGTGRDSMLPGPRGGWVLGRARLLCPRPPDSCTSPGPAGQLRARPPQSKAMVIPSICLCLSSGPKLHLALFGCLCANYDGCHQRPGGGRRADRPSPQSSLQLAKRPCQPDLRAHSASPRRPIGEHQEPASGRTSALSLERSLPR